MPELTGIVTTKAQDRMREMTRACTSLVYCDWRNVPSGQPALLLGQVLHHKLGKPVARGEDKGFGAWVEGECYNLEEIRAALGKPVDSLADLFIAGEREGRLAEILRLVDGEFTGILYDFTKGRLSIIADRLGLRPLYLFEGNGEILFASELKGLLAFDGFIPRLDREAVACFLDLGHLLGRRTWFKGVELVPPASLITVDVTTCKIVRRERYWGWGRIHMAQISFEEATDRLGFLLKKSVQNRIFPGEKVTVLLSGGLDSRALLGAVPRELCAGAATIGRQGCKDVTLASAAAGIKGVAHQIYELNQDNWLNERVKAVWRTEGMCSLLDLPTGQFLQSMRAVSPVSLNGFPGDVVAGASSLEGSSLDKRVDASSADFFYGGHWPLDDINDHYYDCPHVEPFLIANRGRRMISAGIKEASDIQTQRKPFMSNAMLEFLFSLPDGMRAHQGLYHKALLKAFPELFRKIPRQKTGRSISRRPSRVGIFFQKLKRMPVKLVLQTDYREFHDYPAWLSASRSQHCLNELLGAKGAIFRELKLPGLSDFKWQDVRIRSMEQAVRLGRLLTLEIWLQQVFNGKYREGTSQC